jgi:hypothetical protein
MTKGTLPNKAGWRLLASALAMLAAVAGSAAAQGPSRSDSLALHGYGHVISERSHATDRPEHEIEHDLSLLGTWAFHPRAKAWMQIAHLSETGRLRLDWAFVSFELHETCSVYAGQARLPIGLGNETRDVQALRPSATLPLLYNDDLGLADEAFQGAMIEERLRWPANVDLTVEAYAAAAMVPDADDAQRGRVLGGRVSLQPEGTGLTFKLSGYAGRVKTDEDARARKQALVASVMLERETWSLQAEYGQARLGEQSLALGYVQADYRLAESWQVFTRFDQGSQREQGVEPLRERSLAMGLAWKPSQHWGMRLEWSHHRGQIASEEDEQPARPRWNKVALSANYMF